MLCILIVKLGEDFSAKLTDRIDDSYLMIIPTYKVSIKVALFDTNASSDAV